MPVAEIQKELNLDIQLESALNICGINMPPEKVQILVAAFNRVSTPTKNRVQILQILFQVNLLTTSGLKIILL